MTLAQMIPLMISISIFLIVFALGLKTEKGDAVYLLARPSLLIRSILSMNVVMAATAAAVAAILDLAPAIEIALVALAISPVPPILPNKQRKAGGSASFAIGLLVAASIASIVLAPIAVSLLGYLFGREAGIPAGRIAGIVLVSVIIPLALGIAVRAWLPGIAGRLARPASLAGTALLALAALPVLFTATPALRELIGNGVVAVLIAFTLTGLLVGHLLGGPEPGHRTVLALATGTRHPGVAIAIAGLNFPDETATLAVVLCHLVIGTIVSFPYVRWRSSIAIHAEESR